MTKKYVYGLILTVLIVFTCLGPPDFLTKYFNVFVCILAYLLIFYISRRFECVLKLDVKKQVLIISIIAIIITYLGFAE